jgi:hypothetical protein
MLRRPGDINVFKFNTIIIGIFLFFSVMMCFNRPVSSSGVRSHSGSVYIIENRISAVHSADIRIQVFQKTWILNKDNFNLLAFNRNPISDNKRTSLNISRYQTFRRCYPDIPQFLHRYHQFPEESEDLPVLS